jgi:hypothetical protein
MKYADFSQFIRPEVQGCPDYMIERAVRDSAVDFCTRTDVYVAEPEFVTIVQNVNEYDLSIDEGSELNHILDIFNNTTKLKPVSYSVLLGALGNESTTGTPQYYAQRDNTQFYLAPIPSTSSSYRVLYSLKPSSTSTSIPDTIGKEYREAISHGALFRLQMMAGQPFGNLSLAGTNRDLFEKSIGRTIRQVKYGFSGGSLTAKSREFI